MYYDHKHKIVRLDRPVVDTGTHTHAHTDVHENKENLYFYIIPS